MYVWPSMSRSAAAVLDDQRFHVLDVDWWPSPQGDGKLPLRLQAHWPGPRRRPASPGRPPSGPKSP